MCTIFKVFIEFVTILLLLYVFCFGHEACGILALRPGIKPTPPALKGEVLTTGPPGKSLEYCVLNKACLQEKRVNQGLLDLEGKFPTSPL